MNMQSDLIKKGVERAPNRSLLYALGLTDEEIQRPIIGVATRLPRQSRRVSALRAARR